MKFYEKKTFKNPINPGFYPDPSVIRVGEDYYLVNSSFEYFPAIPVFHSKDLVNWTQIANAVDRADQKLGLETVGASGGVQACTIRYSETRKKYYITSTAIGSLGRQWGDNTMNFIVEADHPAGPWSEVHWIEDAPGIDSSLFFDDDGKAYFHANRMKEVDFRGVDAEIWVQEIDLENFKLVGEKHALWSGMGGIFPEGPHIYKRNGFYYLFVAEGGTLHFHSMTLARSENVFGPYQHSERNPLITHRHLHKSYPIQNIGHADIVETQNGEWYMVALGSRPKGGFYDDNNNPYDASPPKHTFGGYYRNLGRETFLIPMVWEDDWGPIVAPGYGKVEEEFPFPNLEEHKWESEESLTDFTTDLGMHWVFVRNDQRDFYKIENDQLVLNYSPDSIDSPLSTRLSWVGRRQRHWDFLAQTKIISDVKDGERAGITNYMNDTNHIDFYVEGQGGKIVLVLETKNKTKVGSKVNKTEEISYNGSISLKVEAHEQSYVYYYKTEKGPWIRFAEADGRFISADVAGGHTGSFVAMFASAEGKDSKNTANFDYFLYKELMEG